MKTITKIITILALGFFMLIPNKGTATINPINSTKCYYEFTNSLIKKVKIKIHIDWGRVSRNCRGFGICDVDITIDVPMIEMFGFRTVGEIPNDLTLYCDDDLYKQIVREFGGEVIIIEEDFTLSEEVAEAFGFKESFTIKKGKYPLKVVKIEEGTFHAVTFN